MNGTATLAKTWYIAFSGEKKKKNLSVALFCSQRYKP